MPSIPGFATFDGLERKSNEQGTGARPRPAGQGRDARPGTGGPGFRDRGRGHGPGCDAGLPRAQRVHPQPGGGAGCRPGGATAGTDRIRRPPGHHLHAAGRFQLPHRPGRPDGRVPLRQQQLCRPGGRTGCGRPRQGDHHSSGNGDGPGDRPGPGAAGRGRTGRGSRHVLIRGRPARA